MIWILLVLAYGIIKGLREIFKKKALETSSTIEVLFLYTFISFLLVTPEIPNAGGVSAGTMVFIAVKSFVIFVAWMAGFTAVKNIPVGLYGVLDQARVIFSTLLGVIVLNEIMDWSEVVGLILVLIGLIMLKFTPGQKKGKLSESSEIASGGNGGNKVRTLFIVLTLLSCFLNALSGLFDKMLMSRGDLTDGQLQFWYMLFLVIYYLLFIIIRRPGVNWKGALKNKWIWILAVLFVIADRCLFIANGYPESKVTVMTLIKQSCCVVTIIGSRIVFKERNIGYKLICAGVVIAGIVVTVIL